MDPLDLMNKVCQWKKDPPPPDERWEKKIAALCEYAVACRSLTFLRLKETNAVRKGGRYTELKREISDTVDKIIAMEEVWHII